MINMNVEVCRLRGKIACRVNFRIINRLLKEIFQKCRLLDCLIFGYIFFISIYFVRILDTNPTTSDVSNQEFRDE